MHPLSHPLVILLPVYEDLPAVSTLLAMIKRQCNERVHVVVVDDGSVSQPVTTALFQEAEVDGTLVTLKRTVGHQKALSIGLNTLASRLTDNAHVVIMDSDGEDPPEAIPELVELLESDDVDIVVAARGERVETTRFKIFYWLYKRLFHLLSGKTIDFGNFMALKPRAVARIAVMPETSTHVAAGVLASKLRITSQPVDRTARISGHSKMNFVGLTLHGFRALMVFADAVLVRVGIASLSTGVLATLGVVIALVLKSMGHATPGWFSVVSGILFLVVTQTTMLALLLLMITGLTRREEIAPLGSYDAYIEKVSEHRCQVEP